MKFIIISIIPNWQYFYDKNKNKYIINNLNKLRMRTNKIGRYKLYRTLGEGSFAKVKRK